VIGFKKLLSGFNCPAISVIINFNFFSAIPVEEANKSKHVAIVVTARGGHIGFLEGLFPLFHEQYMCRLFTQYFSAIFADGSDLLATIKKPTNTPCIDQA
jgi:hypothetical protein